MYNKDEEKERIGGFKRNQELEALLGSLNSVLACAEDKILEEKNEGESDYPLIFIMGPLRSGTTLFMQWLATTGVVAYPCNLLSRFYGAPVLGAKIQIMLTDPMYNFRDEILDFNGQITFESENGKTKGALSPNEFWYFWRRFLPFHDIDWLSDEELHRVVDRDKLVNELTTLTRVFDKPFALKSMILNYNIPYLDSIFKKAIFVQIKRDPVTNVASILDARKRQLGNEREWYSFKIPEYPELKDLDPVMQAAGQLHYINKAVNNGLSKVDESRKMTVQYENFCENPVKIFEDLAKKLKFSGEQCSYTGVEFFRTKREVNISESQLIKDAISSFSEK